MMKSNRGNFSKRIIKFIRRLSARLSSCFDWIKRKYFHKKAKIESEEKLKETDEKSKIESEVKPQIQKEGKTTVEKKEAKKEVPEEREKEAEITEKSFPEPEPPEKEEITEEKPSEKKQKEEEKSEEPVEEILKERKEEQEPKEEKKEGKIPKGEGRKPYIKKPPTEESEKKPEKHPPTERKKIPERKKEAVDLGNASKGKYKRKTQPKQEDMEIAEERKEEKLEEKEIPKRIESPFVDINLDELEVSLVLPIQQFKVDRPEEIPKQLFYKIEINGEEQREIPVKVKSLNQIMAQTKEERIHLEEPLKSFEIIFPDELQGGEYKYNHRKKFLYAFAAIGNNRGRMCYLYDSEGNFIALPKQDVWVLLNEDFELKTEEVKVEEDNWIWNTHKPFLIDLKKTNNLIIESKNTGSIEKLSCSKTFSIEGGQIIEDDFKEGSPILIGDVLKIKAPIENPDGWCVWIQSKKIGHKIVTENWSGTDELKLKLPDCLPCEYGEFQVDICPKDTGEADETLFFRWIDFIELKYPKNLIFPDASLGSKAEHIKISLSNIEDWDIKCKENLKTNIVEGNFCDIEVHPEKDLVNLFVSKKGTPENELRLQITIPRLKWRTSRQSFWRDKTQEIKREKLNLEDNLIIRTNDRENRYDMIAALEINGKQLQESRFKRKGFDYLTDLRRFYDTVKKNKEGLKLRVKINKNSNLLGIIDVFDFMKEIEPAKIKKRRKRKTKIKRRRIKFPKSAQLHPMVKSKKKMRKGRGFSEKELIEAGIDIKDVYYLSISYDKRRKSSHKFNIETLKKLKRGN
jgi:ribosomal protein L13E